MKWKFLYQSILLLSFCAIASSFWRRFQEKNHYSVDDIRVVSGTHECISNCSLWSGNRLVSCAAEECHDIAASLSSPQRPDVEDVYFEVFTDEVSEENKLALNVKWSPVDNVSLERMNGYYVNISDGLTTITMCYNIGTKLDFYNDTKLTTYNDCYGKASKTEVRLGSTITVSIYGLPRYAGDMDDSKTTFKVDVPDCKSEDSRIQSLSECVQWREKYGPPPTSKQCAQDCDTYSVMNNVTYPVNCSVSKSTLDRRLLPERCDPVNRTRDGWPSQPLRVEKAMEWYKFKDTNGDVKVALNFSWTPANDASMSALEGYYMEIMNTGVPGTTGYNKCFSVHTVLDETKHSAAEFFYDCYGRERVSIVTPGHEYLVHLESRPKSPDGLFLKFLIQVPNCVDPSMSSDVTECIKENGRRLEGQVEEIFCHNRSMKYRYNVSKEYGDRATVVFCERGPNLQHCKNELIQSEDMDLENTLYNISLSSAANLSVNYTIYVHGNEYPIERNKSHPDFSHCVVNSRAQSYPIVTGILITGILILLATIFILWFCCRKNLNILKKFRRPKRNDDPPHRDTELAPGLVIPAPASAPPVTAPHPIAEKLRVYVIFAEDHEIHKNVIHWFCSFLKADLGLDVRNCMWDNIVASANPTRYMTENLKLADKVIIICSAGTKKCMDREWQGQDMFTPVVRNIVQDAFVGKNPGKFLVGYFDYSHPTDVPEYLYDQTVMYFSLFRLMKQFESFYFRLVGIEQYQEGGIQRIDKIAFDRYQDLTSCGMKLKNTIEEMIEFVRENPNWYTDMHGSDLPTADIPPSPARTRRPVTSRTDQTVEPRMAPDDSIDMDRVQEGMASINLLHLSSPPELPNGEAGARRKKTNVPNQSHVQNLQHRQDERRMVAPILPPGNMFGPNNTGGRSQHYSGPGSSMMSQSSAGDESFMINETETEDLSFSTQSSRLPLEQDDMSPTDMRFHSVGEEYTPSYFKNEDENSQQPDFDSRLLTNLPSNETQITRVGYPEERILPSVPESEILISGFGDLEEHAADESESGVYSLTLVSMDDVAEDLDMEEQIKSINQLIC